LPQKNQVSLKSDKNNCYFTRRSMYSYDNILLLLLCMRNVSDKIVEKINTHFSFPVQSFFSW